MATKTHEPATDKQLAFAIKLLADRDWSSFGEDTLNDAQIVLAGGSIPKVYCSGLIDSLLAMPKKAGAGFTPEPTVGPGIYRAPNGDVIKVKATKDKQRVYAQVMVSKSGGERINLNDEVIPNFDFVYTPGLIKHITPAMKLTLDEAKAFYTRTGRCMNCKKELKVATSIAQGLGPVCAKMFA